MVEYYGTVDDGKLPLIWLQHIDGIWSFTKKIPEDYPTDTNVEFSDKLSSEEKVSVSDMISSINTEDSKVASIIPENNYVKNIISTYNATATEGNTENILLSPHKIDENTNVAAAYLDGKDWKSVSNISIKDGYAYGSIGTEEVKEDTKASDENQDEKKEDSSEEVVKAAPKKRGRKKKILAAPEKKDPVTYTIAVFEIKKDIEETDIVGKDGTTVYACNGNTSIILDDEEGNAVLSNIMTGKKIVLKGNPSVFGGSIDGTEIKSTNIFVKSKNNPNLCVIAGSLWNGDTPIHVNNAKVTIQDSSIYSVVGSDGKVHTNNLTITVSNSTVANAIGAGCSWSMIYGLDVNADVVKKTTPEYYEKLGLGANSWTKKSVITLNNVINPWIACAGTPSGYSYTEDGTLNIDGGKYSYIIAGGSNGLTAKSTVNIKNATADVLQTVNRGLVKSANITISDSKIAMIFADGDQTDKTVTGTTDGPVNIEINAPQNPGSDNYLIYAGVDGGVKLTKEKANSIINKIKISRSANYTIADDSKEVLNDKIVIK